MIPLCFPVKDSFLLTSATFRINPPNIPSTLSSTQTHTHTHPPLPKPDVLVPLVSHILHPDTVSLSRHQVTTLEAARGKWRTSRPTLRHTPPRDVRNSDVLLPSCFPSRGRPVRSQVWFRAPQSRLILYSCRCLLSPQIFMQLNIALVAAAY